MRWRVIVSLTVIVACVGTILAVRAVRNRPAPAADNPVEVLRQRVAKASSPAMVVISAPLDVASTYVLSLSDRPAPNLADEEVKLLEDLATQASPQNMDSLAQGRNAVMAAGHSLASAMDDATKGPRLRRILLGASANADHRMRSTFIAVCTQRPELLKDGEIATAVRELAGANDKDLKISERAGALIAPAKDVPSPGGGPP